MKAGIDRQAAAGLALAASAIQQEAEAREWGGLAIRNIRAGNFQTAINQLKAGINATINSQYHGPDFSK